MWTGFHARLWGALLLTLLALGAVQYFVLSHDTRTRLFEDQAKVQRADADALVRAYKITVPGEVPLNSVNRYLRAVSARGSTTGAELVDSSGARLAAGTVLGIGVADPDKHIARSLESGRQYAGPADNFDEEKGELLFVTPVRGIPGGKHALVVRQTRTVLDARLGDIRQTLLVLILGGGLFGIVAFYFLGGRSLVRLHRAAVQRASLDGLTDLPNHRAFKDELDREVSLARRHHEDLTLVLFDVDDFRFHNDTLGHGKADRILLAMADSLRTGRAEDRAFRIGGDEFALILPRTDIDRARTAVRAVASRMAELSPAQFSAGLATCSPEIEDGDGLRSQADAATFEAKRRGGAETVSFVEVEDAQVITASKVRAVRKLLVEGHIEAAYQPIWHIDGTTLLGYEGLARPSNDYGLAGPGEAFDVAGAIGRSAELDDLCREAILAGAGNLPGDALLFVNVTPQSLDGERLAGDRLVREVQAAGLEPSRVVFEVTERFEGSVARVVSEATRLRGLGFKLALDDVGAGNSGLQMLRELELDFVKVDREVVVRGVADATARAVLVSIMAFARHTGAFVIAEGIEDSAMFALARDPTAGAPEQPAAQGVQGYLFGRPGALPDPAATAHSPAEKVLGSL
jgi:diguanylate cyclase (GGDEF)-like protein